MTAIRGGIVNRQISFYGKNSLWMLLLMWGIAHPVFSQNEIIVWMPSQGDVFEQGQSTIINWGWTTPPPSWVTQVTVDLYRDGQLWDTNIATGSSSNTYLPWTVPETLWNRAVYHVRVRGVGGGGWGESGTFWVSPTNAFPSSGNAGAGTASPTRPLHVVGDTRVTGNIRSGDTIVIDTGRRIRAADGTAGTPAFRFSAQNGVGMYRAASNDLRFVTNGTIRLRLTNSYVRSYVRHRVHDGTVASPGINFLLNANTGIWRPGSNIIGFSTNGNERVRLDANGYLGIGTTNPSRPLHVSGDARVTGHIRSGDTAVIDTGRRIRAADGTAGTPAFRFSAQNGVGMYRAASNDLRFVTNGTTRLRLTNSYVRSYVRHRVHDGTVASPGVTFISDTNTGIRRPGTDIMGFSTNGAERLRITAGGNVGIGTTNPGERLAVNGDIKTKKTIITEQSSDWPDFVFASDYQLTDLYEVEEFVASHHRLPGMPSVQEIAEQGQNLGHVQRLLLEKIEELTLHLISMKKEQAFLLAEYEDLITEFEQL